MWAFAAFLVALGSRFGNRLGVHLAVDFALCFRLLAQAVVVLATLRLPRRHQRRYRAEWLGELDALRTETATPPTVSLLAYALPLLFKAGRMARELTPQPAVAATRRPPRGSSSRSYLTVLRARRRGRLKQLKRRAALVSLAAMTLGLPGASFGFDLIDRTIVPVLTRAARGVETSETMRDLLKERAALRNGPR